MSDDNENDGPRDHREIRDPHVARLKDPEGVHTAAWSRLLEEMDALAEGRRKEGWDVTTVVAAHTDTVSKDMRDHDRFGLMHIVPDNHAEEFTDAYDPDAFTEYLAYGNEVEKFLYVVTELIDPENSRSVMIASRYDMVMAGGMVQSAHEEGVLYTYVKTIDGTILGTFEHEEFDPLISSPKQEN